MNLRAKPGYCAQNYCGARQWHGAVLRCFTTAALVCLVGGLTRFIPLSPDKEHLSAAEPNAMMRADQTVKVNDSSHLSGVRPAHPVFGLEPMGRQEGAVSAEATAPSGGSVRQASAEEAVPGKVPFRKTEAAPGMHQAMSFGANGRTTVRPPAPVPKDQHPALKTLTMADFPTPVKSVETIGQNEISEDGLYAMFASGTYSIGWIRGVNLSPEKKSFTDRRAVQVKLPPPAKMSFGSSIGERPDGKKVLLFADDEAKRPDGPIINYLAVDGEEKLWEVTVPPPEAQTGLFSALSPQIAPNGSLWQEMFTLPRRHPTTGDPTGFALARVLPAEQGAKLGPLSAAAASTVPGHGITFGRQNISTVWDKSGNFYQPSNFYSMPHPNIGRGADIFRFDISRYPEKLSYTPLDSLRSDRIITKNGERMREQVNGLGLVGWHQNKWWVSTATGSRWRENGILAVDPITGAVLSKNLPDVTGAGPKPDFLYLKTGIAREFVSSGELVPSVLLDVDHEMSQTQATFADIVKGRVTVKNTGGGAYTGPVTVDLGKLLPYADYSPQETRLRVLDVNGEEYAADVDWLEGPVGGSVGSPSDGGRLTWQGTIPSDARLVWEYQLRAKDLGSAGEVVTASVWTPETDQAGESLVSRCSDSYEDHEVVPGTWAKQQCSAGIEFRIPSTLKIAKSAEVSGEGVVTYKITAKNMGWDARNVSDMRDDMSEVLNQSVFKGVTEIAVVDATGRLQRNDVKARLNGKTLEFSGSVPAGYTLRVVYQVQLTGKGQAPP